MEDITCREVTSVCHNFLKGREVTSIRALVHLYIATSLEDIVMRDHTAGVTITYDGTKKRKGGEKGVRIDSGYRDATASKNQQTHILPAFIHSYIMPKKIIRRIFAKDALKGLLLN